MRFNISHIRENKDIFAIEIKIQFLRQTFEKTWGSRREIMLIWIERFTGTSENL